jgi:hypothetical protein
MPWIEHEQFLAAAFHIILMFMSVIAGLHVNFSQEFKFASMCSEQEIQFKKKPFPMYGLQFSKLMLICMLYNFSTPKALEDAD